MSETKMWTVWRKWGGGRRDHAGCFATRREAEMAAKDVLRRHKGVLSVEIRMSEKKYRHLGYFAEVRGYEIGLDCHHCRVSWTGCAAAAHCPECGAPKNYHGEGECCCELCRDQPHDEH